MKLEEHFYFGPVPEEYKKDHDVNIPKDWKPGWYFRIRVDFANEEIKVEDSCGRMVPFCFEHIKPLRRALKTVKETL